MEEAEDPCQRAETPQRGAGGVEGGGGQEEHHPTTFQAHCRWETSPIHNESTEGHEGRLFLIKFMVLNSETNSLGVAVDFEYFY